MTLSAKLLTCGVVVARGGFNARCDFPVGHVGPCELVIALHPDCKTCQHEPHDLHQRELLLPPGYIECADCTAVTEVVPAFAALTQARFRRALCVDCYQLAYDQADPMSGGGYTRQAKSFADARPYKPIKAGDVVTFSWTGDDDGGLWVHGSPADG